MYLILPHPSLNASSSLSPIRTWFQLVNPCAWCNADHTSIHCKWTSILVINTSRLSSLYGSHPDPHHHPHPHPHSHPPAYLQFRSLWVHRSTHFVFRSHSCTVAHQSERTSFGRLYGDFSPGFACKWYACWRIRLTALRTRGCEVGRMQNKSTCPDIDASL